MLRQTKLIDEKHKLFVFAVAVAVAVAVIIIVALAITNNRCIATNLRRVAAKAVAVVIIKANCGNYATMLRLCETGGRQHVSERFLPPTAGRGCNSLKQHLHIHKSECVCVCVWSSLITAYNASCANAIL